MFIVYTLGTNNKRILSERAVHMVDTELPERFFVSYTTQSERAVKKVVDQMDDFAGDQTKDLTKPFTVVGIKGDAFGQQLIEELLKRQPLFVEVKPGIIGKAFK